MRAVAIALVVLALVGFVHATNRSVRQQRQHALQAGSLDAQRAAATAKASQSAQWDVLGGGLKDQLHEKITLAALANLVREHPDAGNYLLSDNLINGVRWNDLPTGNKNTYLNMIDFLVDFEFPKGPLLNTLVHNTHFGCQQHNHAMAPVFSPRPGITGTVHFANKDVLRIIIEQAKHWWVMAVAAANSNAPDKWATASHYIGHFAHLLEDSYAPGHTVRGYLQQWDTATARPEQTRENVAPHTALDDASMANQCGHIIHFEGYTSQEGNSGHGDKDHDPTDLVKGAFRTAPDKAVCARLNDCSRSAAHQLFLQFYLCVTTPAGNVKGVVSRPQCDFATLQSGIFDHHFVLSKPNELAGGTSFGYAGKIVTDALAANAAAGPWRKIGVSYVDVVGNLHNTDADAIVEPRPNPATDFIWSIGSTAGTQGGVKTLAKSVPICVPFTARVGPGSLLMHPFLDYPNVDNTYVDHNVPLRATRPADDAQYQI